MDKRFLLALMLCLAVLFLWQQFVIGPAKPPPPKPDAPATEGGDTKPPEGGAKPAEPAAPAAPEPAIDPALVKTAVIGNRRLRLEVTNLGAAVRWAELLDFSPTAREKEEHNARLRFLVESGDGLHALRLDDLDHPHQRLGETLWDMRTGEDGRSVTFTADLSTQVKDKPPEVIGRITKEIRLPSDDARHAIVRISCEFPGEKQGQLRKARFGLLATGGVFQEVGGEAMTPPRAALNEVEGKFKLVPFGELAKPAKEARDRGGAAAYLRGRHDSGGLKFAIGGAHRLVADLSNYLGAFLLLREFPAQTTGVIHLLGDPESNKIPDRKDFGADNPRTASLVEWSEDVEIGGGAKTWEALLYLGPIDEKVIAAEFGADRPGEAEALSGVYRDQLGMFSFIGRAVLWALNAFRGLTGNWGWSIVLLTLCVRILLFPINRRSQGAMLRHGEAMARIKPKLEELKKRYEKEPKKYAAAQMELFKAEKVPLVPLGGCLPILLQIPIFFGLFAALRAAIDLRQASWLWVKDLSQPDHLVTFAGDGLPNPLKLCGSCCGMPQTDTITGLHVLPLLMTAAWVVSSWMMPKPATNDPQMEQQRKIMMFMPLIFGLTMYGYAAGLSLYWLTSSLVGIFESQVIKKVWPVKGMKPPKAG